VLSTLMNGWFTKKKCTLEKDPIRSKCCVNKIFILSAPSTWSGALEE